MKVQHYLYDSYESALDAAEKTTNRGSGGSHAVSYGFDFGMETFEQAIQFARYGWPEGLNLVTELAAKIGRIIGERVYRPAPVYAVAGAIVDVPRAIRGIPESMIAFPFQAETASGKIVKLVVGIGCRGDVTGKTIKTRGAAILALIDAIESAGYRVELWLDSVGTIDGKALHFRFPAKMAEEHLDRDRLAFALINPSMHRRIVFALREMADPELCRQGGGQVGTVPMRQSLPAEKSAYVIDNVDGNPDEFADSESATAWVFQQLDSLGVEYER